MSTPATEYEEWIREYAAARDGNVRYRCQGASNEMVEAFIELRLVRGYVVHKTGWKTAHWWCETSEGVVVDPTAAQFDDIETYEEYDEEKHGPLPTGKCMDCGAFVYDGGHNGFCDDRCQRATEHYLDTVRF